MKKIIYAILPVLFLALFLNGCRKEESTSGTIFNTNFYTSSAAAKGKMYLFVDDKSIGELPYFSKNPGCGGTSGDGTKPLNMQLKSGTHSIVGKDESGKIRSSGTIKISKSSMSSSVGIGGQEMYSSGDCLIIGLFE